MARVLALRGHNVLAIDADPDANLASALGIEEKVFLGLKPLAQMTEFIQERTAAKKGAYGSFFKINPRVDDIPDAFSIRKDGVRLVVLGYVPQGGGGCLCPENALLRSFLSHVFIERDEHVIVDMEAGLEHLGRGTTSYVDALIVVVEPGKRSLQTAKEVKRLASHIGVMRVFVVGNKVAGEDDKALIAGGLEDLKLIGFMSYNEKVIEADKKGVSPFDLDGGIRREVENIIDALSRELA